MYFTRFAELFFIREAIEVDVLCYVVIILSEKLGAGTVVRVTGKYWTFVVLPSSRLLTEDCEVRLMFTFDIIPSWLVLLLFARASLDRRMLKSKTVLDGFVS